MEEAEVLKKYEKQTEEALLDDDMKRYAAMIFNGAVTSHAATFCIVEKLRENPEFTIDDIDGISRGIFRKMITMYAPGIEAMPVGQLIKNLEEDIETLKQIVKDEESKKE